eukprot:CAMPEP_0176342798 /NCGR_PEP_ID=MMETSP0126-20121128/3461_1 /TAXON_ID=141414 ORGANISM="Strombidinopsis acuminatum, Strain SPMC142" /NCGR_SAMPLE_ID=MMETSP0126 /ASSEMBLY_ACC=CAM_ASM_000229 /LENGTH=105 /DNA_ID=CAMNT_0017688421 /DNA_START=307 /DNA_END=624 /DNA_ORIENTATION=+
MTCTTSIDLTKTASASSSSPDEPRQNSVLKSIEKVNVEPLVELDESIAMQMLAPLHNTCGSIIVDIWNYEVCVGNEIMQKSVPLAGRQEEEFAIGESILNEKFEK